MSTFDHVTSSAAPLLTQGLIALVGVSKSDSGEVECLPPFRSAVDALNAALVKVSGLSLSASIWVGDLAQDSLATAQLSACTAVTFAEPGKILLTLSAAEMLRKALPAGALLLEIGNRELPTGVERLFVLDPNPIAINSLTHLSLEDELVFVGRETEFATLLDMVAHNRVITLCGQPGSGRTTLAKKTIQTLESQGRSTWYVDLSSLQTGPALAATLASLLEIPKEVGQTYEDALRDHLADQRGVIILDSVEVHPESAKRFVAECLTDSTDITVLLISTNPLRLKHEQFLEIGGLKVPQRKEPWQSMREYEALQFFEACARTVEPNFELTAENTEIVSVLCTRLEGNPTALKLAALKLRTLSVLQIIRRLDQRLALLKPDRKLARSQRSLHEIVGLSVESLSESAKSLLSNICAIEGGISLDVAEALSAGANVLHAFEELVDSRALHAYGESKHTKYFRLDENIQAYAQDSLEKEDYLEILQRKYNYFIKFVAQAEAGLQSEQEGYWIECLTFAARDLVATVHHLVSVGKPQEAAEILFGTYLFWYEKNFSAQGLELCRLILRSKIPFEGRQKLSLCKAIFTVAEGDYKDARTLAIGIAKTSKAQSEKRLYAGAISILGQLDYYEKNFLSAKTHYQNAAEIYREIDLPTNEFNTRVNLLGQLNDLGDMKEVEIVLDQLHDLAERTAQPPSYRAHLLNNSAMAFISKDRFGEAISLAQKALAEVRDQDLGAFSARLIRVISLALLKSGNYQDGVRLLGASERLLQEDDAKLNPAEIQAFEEKKIAAIKALGAREFETQFKYFMLESTDMIVDYAMTMTA